MIAQRTLKDSVEVKGIGLHSGEQVTLILKPAPVDAGIVFRRVDLEKPVNIRAHPSYVGNTALSTCLEKHEVSIRTVEHLMSALAGLSIDNVYINLNAAELPAMDGSAYPFIVLIKSVGIQEQDKTKKFIRIKRPIEIKLENKFLRLEPYEGFTINFRINYDHPVIRNSDQSCCFDFSVSSYIKEVSKARTFGFLSDYDWLRRNNLALGAGLENTIVLDESQVLNTEGLRYMDEFIKHKILDVIGDLYLLGSNMLGKLTGYRAGHDLNIRLAKAILEDKTTWELVSFENSNQAPFKLESNFF